MSWSPRRPAEQTGRAVVVTGANSGIGWEVARSLLGRGAHVVMAVRDTVKGATARLWELTERALGEPLRV